VSCSGSVTFTSTDNVVFSFGIACEEMINTDSMTGCWFGSKVKMNSSESNGVCTRTIYGPVGSNNPKWSGSLNKPDPFNEYSFWENVEPFGYSMDKLKSRLFPNPLTTTEIKPPGWLIRGWQFISIRGVDVWNNQVSLSSPPPSSPPYRTMELMVGSYEYPKLNRGVGFSFCCSFIHLFRSKL